MSGLASTAIKQALAFLVYRSGLLHLWVRWKLEKRPLLVMYHRVLESGTDFSQDGIVVSPDTFEKQLFFLNRMFRIVSFAEACDGIRPFLCAITFDDGWEDNHRLAFPMLQRMGFPATLFVTTGYIGTSRLFWPERLTFILQDLKEGELPDNVASELPDSVAKCLSSLSRISGEPGSAPQALLDRLIELLKEVEEEARENFLSHLARLRKRDDTPSVPRMLNWDQVRGLHRQGFEIGSHTVSHALLTQASPTRVREELEQSREQITAQLQWVPQSFAYPNGNWSPDLSAAVRRAGYVRAVTTEAPWTPLSERDANWSLPRKNLCESSSKGFFGFSGSIFACEAVGFFDWCRASWKKK